MRKLVGILLLGVLPIGAEVRTLTLRETVDLALKQNPDVVLARLDERRAHEAVRVAHDPFVPALVAGSGLAYTSGFPMSIDGAAPSVIQAKAVQSLYNRPQTYLMAQAKENSRGAAMGTQAKRQEVALRAALLFLDVERAAGMAKVANQQVTSLEKVAEAVEARVKESRELPIENKRAALNLARARQRQEALEDDMAFSSNSLAVVLGFTSSDRILPAPEERPEFTLPISEEVAVGMATQENMELRRLQSALLSKEFGVKAAKAERLPRVDLVAQYGLFAKYNNYDAYYREFQRNNGQVGISVQIPLLLGPGADARAAQASAEIAQLKIQINGARNRISLETRRGFQDVRKAETACEVARLDFDVAHEQVSILLAQTKEGRAGLRQVEEARFAENEKWLAYQDAHYQLERARLTLLKQSGDLVAALR
jgi:outer membrane protein